MLRIGMLFISQTLAYSYNIVTFVVGKVKLVTFSLFLDAFPP